ncbi:MAG: hypothetical protein ACI8ZN_000342 [Bacteroidia bacterium]|jgi:hypothetical protein
MRYVFQLILIVCGMQAFAQGRACDATCAILSPIPTEVIQSPTVYDCQVALINLGPDTIKPGDEYSIGVEFGAMVYFPSFGKFTETILPGDSVFRTKTLNVNLVGNVVEAKFCAEVLFWRGGYDSLKLETPQGRKNNKVCIEVEHRDQNYGLSSNKPPLDVYVLIYPNPASKLVQINSDLEIKSVELFNALGQKVNVPTMFNQDAQRFDLVVASLPKGLYYVHVELASGIVRKPIVVSR